MKSAPDSVRKGSKLRLLLRSEPVLPLCDGCIGHLITPVFLGPEHGRGIRAGWPPAVSRLGVHARPAHVPGREHPLPALVASAPELDPALEHVRPRRDVAVPDMPRAGALDGGGS